MTEPGAIVKRICDDYALMLGDPRVTGIALFSGITWALAVAIGDPEYAQALYLSLPPEMNNPDSARKLALEVAQRYPIRGTT